MTTTQTLLDEAYQSVLAGNSSHAYEIYCRLLEQEPENLQILNNLGLLCCQTGQMEAALSHYQKCLELDPENPDWANNLAVICQNLKRIPEALIYLEQALTSNPKHADANFNMGIILLQQGEWEKALPYCGYAVQERPTHAEAYNNLGHACQKTNRLQDAIVYFTRALELKPDYAEACCNLGSSYRLRENLDKAITFYNKAIELNPHYASAYNNLGEALKAKGLNEEAWKAYERSVDIDPQYADVYNNMGVWLKQDGQVEQARVYFEQALSLNPNLSEGLNNIGNLELMLGNYDKALEYFENAVSVDPQQSKAYNSIGVLHRVNFRFPQAIAAFTQAIVISPQSDIYKNLGAALVEIGQHEEALETYQLAYKLKPNDGLRIKMAQVMPRIYTSTEEIHYWRERFSQQLQELSITPLSMADPEKEISATNFFMAYHGLNDLEFQQRFYQLIKPVQPTVNVLPPKNPKPRLGIISRYIGRNHTIQKLMHGIMEQLPRDEFDIVILTFGTPQESGITAPHTHIDLYPTSVESVAKTIAKQNLDILFYADIGMDPLTYYLAYSRLAPIQCVTWGHPVTTGIDTIDYFLSSTLLEPEDAVNHYSEKLIQLETLPTYYYRPPIPEQSKSLKDFALPEDMHLYLCPQSFFKFHPEFDQILAGILRADPQGILVSLKSFCSEWAEILMNRWKKTMPDVVERIHLTPSVPREDFLSLVSLADVVLDTIHFGGGNSAYEVLAMGTPMVTMPGNFMRGRVTAACYQKMGVLDCIVSTPEDYINLAVKLGTDKGYRETIKAKILSHNDVLFEDQTAVDALTQFFHTALKQAATG